MNSRNTKIVVGVVVAVVVVGSVALAVNSLGRADARAAKKEILGTDKDAKATVAKRPLPEIDIAKLPGDTKEMEKILLMTQEDIQRRLGSYVSVNTSSFALGGAGGEMNMTETQTVTQAADGHYHLVVESEKGKQMEVIYANNACFDRVANEGYRRLVDPGRELFWREKAGDGLSFFYRTLRGFIAIGGPESVTMDGRRMLKFTLSAKPNGSPAAEELPSVYNYPGQYALSTLANDKLADDSNKRIIAVSKLDGTILVDEATKALAGYTVDTKYELSVPNDKPAAGPVKRASLVFTFKTEYHLKQIGEAITVEAPMNVDDKAQPPSLPRNIQKLLPKGAKNNTPEAEKKDDQTKPKGAEPNGTGEE